MHVLSVNVVLLSVSGYLYTFSNLLATFCGQPSNISQRSWQRWVAWLAGLSLRVVVVEGRSRCSSFSLPLTESSRWSVSLSARSPPLTFFAFPLSLFSSLHHHYPVHHFVCLSPFQRVISSDCVLHVLVTAARTLLPFSFLF